MVHRVELTDRLVALLLLVTLAITVSANPEPVPLPISQRTTGSLVERARKKPNYEAHPVGELVCRPFGECEPCPEDDVSGKPVSRSGVHVVECGCGVVGNTCAACL